MRLSVRPKVYTLPSYSLTGDLLGFLRCGLQYRYTRIGKLPAARPVQMWFGQFIHGVLEEAYRRFDAARRDGRTHLPPWEAGEVDTILALVKRRLSAQGLFPWDQELEELGDARARAALDLLGPELFPIIHRAEVRLTGSRSIPVDEIPPPYRFREATRYEMVGVIDVVTHIQLRDRAHRDTRLVQAILEALPTNPPDAFEVIIDYKGMRRPPERPVEDVKTDYWTIYEWQVQTYAHLRRQQEDSLPVVAGVLIYLNELLPTWRDVENMRREMQLGATDVLLPKHIDLDRALPRRPRGHGADDAPGFPDVDLDLRFRRALRVLPVSEQSITRAQQSFDGVVARIEECRGHELHDGHVLTVWPRNKEDRSTCERCDARTFCPSYPHETSPQLPVVRVAS